MYQFPRVFPKLLFIILCLGRATGLFSACIDSVRIEVKAVQCFGMRNGEIHIDTVFGGVRPFYFSNDGNTFSTRPVFDFLWAGNYDIVVRDANGCLWQTEVLVPEPEELRVLLSASDTLVESGVEVRLSAEIIPDTNHLTAVSWRPPYLFEQQELLEQTAKVTQNTPFAIEVHNLNGCVARDQVMVQVEQTHVFIPNIIKPGSDTDAYFTIFAGEGVAQVRILRVFNRVGSMVFERRNFAPNDPIKGWNGVWLGRKVQPGVYPYTTEVEFLDGTLKRFQGTVTVIY
jgi:hypothetical protein